MTSSTSSPSRSRIVAFLPRGVKATWLSVIGSSCCFIFSIYSYRGLEQIPSARRRNSASLEPLVGAGTISTRRPECTIGLLLSQPLLALADPTIASVALDHLAQLLHHASKHSLHCLAPSNLHPCLVRSCLQVAIVVVPGDLVLHHIVPLNKGVRATISAFVRPPSTALHRSPTRNDVCAVRLAPLWSGSVHQTCMAEEAEPVSCLPLCSGRICVKCRIHSPDDILAAAPSCFSSRLHMEGAQLDSWR